jgi:diadenosine tetraphosphatase ApaH/serine/threonine PP2A family protein phosphatase
MEEGLYVPSVIATITELVSQGVSSLVANPSLPPITLPAALDICRCCQAALEFEPLVLPLQGDFVVIGDLHGSVLDLLRLFGRFGMPPATKYVVLGDFVDKGQFSVHTAVYLFATKCRFPRSVYLIRGNHEFPEVNAIYGLLAEVREDFRSTELYTAFNTTFAYLPIAARLNGDFLCLHGGIGPDLQSIDQIDDILRPINEATNIIEAIMWSDPVEGDVRFCRNTKRNRGFEFGERPLADFLARNGLKTIIRGHSYCAEGVHIQFGGKLITVFSASSYVEDGKGCCGAIELSEDGEIKEHKIEALPIVYRHGPKVARAMSIRPPRSSGPLDTRAKRTGQPLIMARHVRGQFGLK